MKRTQLLLPVLLATVAASDTNLGTELYKLPPADGATAVARFPTSGLHFAIKRGDSQYYGVLTGSTCNSARRLVIYSGGLFDNKTERSLPIESGHKLRIVASIQKDYDAGYLKTKFVTCTRAVEFTPEAGKTYIIKQQADTVQQDYCKLNVTEEGSGSPPADIAENAPLKCWF